MLFQNQPDDLVPPPDSDSSMPPVAAFGNPAIFKVFEPPAGHNWMKIFPNYIAKRFFLLAMIVLFGLFFMLFTSYVLVKLQAALLDNASLKEFMYLWMLKAPEFIVFFFPVSLFIACLGVFNTALQQHEITAARAAGLSDLVLVAPVLALALGVSLIHLSVNLWGSPASERQITRIVSDASSNLTGKRLKAGRFMSLAENLTIHVGRSENQTMHDLFIHDTRNEVDVTYIAQRGQSIEQQGSPAIILDNGHIQTLDPEHGLSRLEFTRYVLDLGGFIQQKELVFDRPKAMSLSQLLRPEPTESISVEKRRAMQIEAHRRLSSPLLSLVLTLLALHVVLGTEINRLGYRKRIVATSALAGGLVTGNLLLPALARSHTGFDWLQYVLPLTIMLVLCIRMNLHRQKPVFEPA